MICIVCSNNTKVTNSRPHKKTPSVWRRRECIACATTFTTHEVVADNDYSLTVIDHQNKKSAYSLPRLMMSIAATLGHRPLPPSADEAYWLAQTVTEQIQASATDRVNTSAIAALAYDAVSRFDATAGLQYGARHGLIKNTAQKPHRGRPRTTRRGIS